MTTAKNLTALYPQLSAHERVRLTLAAIARGDADDVQRLRLTCPRRVYEQADADYVDVVEATRLIATQFLALWQEAELALTLSESAPISAKLDHDARAALSAFRLAKMKATRDGLMEFCDLVNLTSSEILAWYPGLEGVVDGVTDTLATDLPTIEGHKHRVVTLLLSGWPLSPKSTVDLRSRPVEKSPFAPRKDPP